MRDDTRQAMLLDLTDRLRPLADPVDIQHALLESVRDHLGVDRAFYVSIDPRSGAVAVGPERNRPGTPPLPRSHLLESLARVSTEAVRTVVADDIHASDRYTDELRAEFDRSGIRSGIVSRVVKDHELVGHLVVAQATARQWTPDEVAVVEDHAERVWSAVEQARAGQALRAEQARLHAVFDAIAEGVIFVNADGELEFANRSVRHGVLRHGAAMPTRDDVAGQVTDIDGGRWRLDELPVMRALATGSPVERTELVWHSPSGPRRYLARAYPVRDDDSTLLGATCTFVDITEQRLAEAQLAQAQRMDAVVQLAGGIAHDFNNMLAIVSGEIELLRDAAGSPEAVAMADRALQALAIGTDLNRRLVAFARSRPLDPQRVDIGARVVGLAELLRRAVSPADLRTELADRLPDTEADPGEIDGVIVNLAVNGRDAMPEGGTLTIRTRLVEVDVATAALHPGAAPGPHVELSVEDTGHGMAPEVARRSVEPFFTTKGSRGTGLGLSSAYATARQSGGFLAIESELGVGTTVRVLLPVAGAPPTAHDGPASTGRPAGCGALVLVVEDTDALRDLTRRRVELLGYRAVAAADGDEAIDLLMADEGIDLVLSDIRMPGSRTGHDLARWVRANRPGTAVVLTTGYLDAPDPTRLVGSEEIEILAKPFGADDLARALYRALHPGEPLSS